MHYKITYQSPKIIRLFFFVDLIVFFVSSNFIPFTPSYLTFKLVILAPTRFRQFVASRVGFIEKGHFCLSFSFPHTIS